MLLFSISHHTMQKRSFSYEKYEGIFGKTERLA